MESWPTVFLDESGNSGQNLLDRQQPVFVLASLQLDDDESQRIAATMAGGADEAHYTRMRKYPDGQRKVLEAIAIRCSRGRFVSAPCTKRSWFLPNSSTC